MSLLGMHLSIAVGPTLPVPAPPELLETVDRIEVTATDEGTSGFQIVLRAGRGERDVIDYPQLGPLLAPGSRVVMVLTAGALPTVLADGLVTHLQLAPSPEPGGTVLAVTGQDLGFAMDREERAVEHVGFDESLIVAKVIGAYARFPLLPVVVPPPVLDVPLPIDRIPVQLETDLAYLRRLADRYDYVFTVTPGPAPGTSTAYWGPLPRAGVPQRALSVGTGPDDNVRRLDVEHDAGAVSAMAGTVQDRLTNQEFPVLTLPTALRPPLALSPALADPTTVRTGTYRAQGARTVVQALAEAQAQQDRTSDAVRVEGELDGARYGGVLQAGGLVGLRGVGFSYDGLYHVRTVTHTLVPSGVSTPSSFTTRFSLRREGQGTTVPAVVVP
jgi:hypothetical protein